MTTEERNELIRKMAKEVQPGVKDLVAALNSEPVTKGFTTFLDEEGFLVFVKRKLETDIAPQNTEKYSTSKLDKEIQN